MNYVPITVALNHFNNTQYIPKIIRVFVNHNKKLLQKRFVIQFSTLK